jgi:phage repressor protein C with HTH and peptisase S24 domain/DNA-binding XRE family transcriptional regulator
LRKHGGYTQAEVAEYLSRYSKKSISFKAVSHWENGERNPNIEQFLLMCKLYGVGDVQAVFYGAPSEYRGLSKLNALGRSRAEEYIAMLAGNPKFSETETAVRMNSRHIRLYDVPVAAGTGSFLDSDSYEEFEMDDTAPDEADFAVKVRGDSMTPRFVDGQIIFIKEQQTLNIGEIGIFELNSDSYVKKLGKGELLSLNKQYKPIPIREYDSFHIFGKAVG